MLVERDRVPRRGAQDSSQSRLVDGVRAAPLFGLVQTDVHVDTHRFGDLGAQVVPDRAAGDSSEDLAENEAEGGQLVTLGGARLPPRCSGSQLPADVVPVGHVPPVHPERGTDDSGTVTHHHADRDLLFAGLSELGPVAGHRRIEVEFAAIGELVHTCAGQSLAAGQHIAQGVLAPRPVAGSVGGSAPQIDDQIAVHPDRDCGADLVAQQEILLECVAHPVEARCTGAADGDVAHWAPSCRAFR
jgi:hypothetical protein